MLLLSFFLFYLHSCRGYVNKNTAKSGISLFSKSKSSLSPGTIHSEPVNPFLLMRKSAYSFFPVLAISTMLPSILKAEEALTYITTESGLKYADLKVGDGAVSLPGDTVRVHYTGWLEGFGSEKKFDSSYDRGRPLVFKVGVRQVISGWDEGILTNLKVGGKRNLIIPPELGYGSRGAGGVIPPGATLYFTVELVGIGAK